MKNYNVTYLNASGKKQSVSVQALSADEAVSLSGIRKSNIVSVKIDYLANFKRDLNAIKIDIRDQAILLQNWSSAGMSGDVPKKIYESLVGDDIQAKVDKPLFEKCETTSDYLELLNFDGRVVNLVRSSEQTDSEIEALEEGAKYLLSEAVIKEKTSAELRSGLFNMLIGIVSVFVGFPIFGDVVIGLSDVAGPESLNALSKLLLGAKSISEFGYIIYPSILGLALYGFYKFKKEPYLKLFSMIYRIHKLKRAIFFSNMYRLLTPKGVTPPKIVDMMLEGSEGFDEVLLKKIKLEITAGKSLKEVMTREHWPVAFITCLSNLDKNNNPAQLDSILKNLTRSLTMELESANSKLSKRIKIIGLALLASSLIVVMPGVYGPVFAGMSNIG